MADSYGLWNVSPQSREIYQRTYFSYSVGSINASSTTVSVSVTAYLQMGAATYTDGTYQQSYSGYWGNANYNVYWKFGNYAKNAIASGTYDVALSESGIQSIGFGATGRSYWGTSSHSISLSIPQKYPNAPTEPTLSRGGDGTSITVTSAAVTYGGTIDSYEYRWSTNNSTWSAAIALDANRQSIHTGLTSTQIYYYQTRAVGGPGASNWSASSSIQGVPSKPNAPIGVRSTSIAGRIDISWTAPTSPLPITNYHLYRNGTYLDQTSQTEYADTGLTRGDSHTYTVIAFNSSGYSATSTASASIMAPGVPNAPGVPTISSKVGRTLTINSTRGSSDYGNTISEYRIQLSTDNGATWKGWDNSTKTFTANNTYNVLDGSGNFTYQLLTPALTYKWRVYAINSIGAGDFATTSTGTFVSSGGKRWNGSSWVPTETAKRWNGSAWVDITIAKRWNGSAWVDLT